MRFEFLCAAACAAVLAVLPAQAADTAQQSAMKSCAATWKTMSAADKAKTKYSDYMSTCMKAPTKSAAAPAPAAPMAMTAKPAASSGSSMAMQAASGGKAKCKDGTVVTYKSRSGTCSAHKGVATWM
ncbi:MAG TPA: DUF3761 domain-containing protein [Rhizomicrobium sp.]|nr:DUF3761 domain-containing protein [Rhizomicrobium sp.]